MTLIELMTALSVMGILVAIAVPSFRSITANSRAQAATSDLVTSLNLARSEALRRSNNVVACASTNQSTCNSANWATGWIVFSDGNGNDLVDAGELVQVFPAIRGGTGMTAIDAGGNVSRVTYNAMGMGQLGAGGRVRFEVTPAQCSGDNLRQTDFMLAGTIQTRKVTCP